MLESVHNWILAMSDVAEILEFYTTTKKSGRVTDHFKHGLYWCVLYLFIYMYIFSDLMI